MTRIIPFVLYLLLIALHQVITRDATMISSAAIDLPGLLVVLVAIYKPEVVCVWFGFAAGLTASAERVDLFGWHALALAFLGLAAFHARQRLNLDSLYAKLVLVFGGILIHNVCFLLLISGGSGFPQLILVSGLTGAAYTTAVAWVFFLFKERTITFQKIKALF